MVRYSLFFYPLILFVLFILAPAFLGLFYYDEDVLKVFFLAVESFLFLMGGMFVSYLLLKRQRQILPTPSLTRILNLLFFLYCISYAYLIFDYGGVPIFKYLLGGGSSNELRSEFYKNKEGLVQIFVYIRSILMKGFIPFFAVYAYNFFSRKGFVFVALIYFVFSFLTFEKANILWFFLPIIVLLMLRHKFKKLLFTLLLVMLPVVTLNILSHSNTQLNNHYTELFRNDWQVGKPLHQHKNYQFYFTDIDNMQSFAFLLDRIFWIPYVTVYDTVRYWKYFYEEEYLGVATNRHLAKLFGVSFSDLEREVFRFQYGGNENTTGNANAAFIAEAYVGYGVIGVALFSVIVGFCSGYIAACQNDLISASFIMFPFAVITSSSLLSMMFSGGGFFYVLLLIFVLRKG